MTVVFEGTYDAYVLHGFGNKIAMLGSSSHGRVKMPREDFGCIMHLAPGWLAINEAAMYKVVQELKSVVGAIFVTDRE
jgi:hypothetical protein